MNICICTTPIRPKPTPFPPLGSMAVITALREIGEDPQFYHMDYFRPNHDEMFKYFTDNQFDIVGISAVVSTAYKVTQDLASMIKKVNPKTIIVVGGSLAASAHLLHSRCAVDFCVSGDGEIIMQDLVSAVKKETLDDETLNSIPGISFIDSHGNFKFTGYGKPLTADKIPDPDFSILEKNGCLDHYIYDQNSLESGNWVKDYNLKLDMDSNKKTAVVIFTKGCVARCTFCHRWENGYRMLPSDKIINHLKHLQDKYNVGCLAVSDENFGSNKTLTKELVGIMGSMGLKWRVGGVRARTVDLETLKSWKDNGCVMVLYGIESGSPTMLRVMEKNVTREQNIKALKWTYEAGLPTVIQLVVGMPGETDKTIEEVISFLLECMPYYSDVFRKKLDMTISVNYAQALPGTPLYEYAREHGFIPKTDDDEEAYLLKISDTNAYKTDHFVNYTQQPLLKVLSWRYWINWELFRYHAKHNLEISLGEFDLIKSLIILIMRPFMKKVFNGTKSILSPVEIELSKYEGVESNDGYFNFRKTFEAIRLLLPWNKYTYPIIVVMIAFKEANNVLESFKLLSEHFFWSINIFRKKLSLPTESLRKLVTISDNDNTVLLRAGR